MFEFPCFITLYYIKNQQDATLAVFFFSLRSMSLYTLALIDLMMVM